MFSHNKLSSSFFIVLFFFLSKSQGSGWDFMFIQVLFVSTRMYEFSASPVAAFHTAIENLAKEDACEAGGSVSRQYNPRMYLWHIDAHTGEEPQAGTKSAPNLNIQGSQKESKSVFMHLFLTDSFHAWAKTDLLDITSPRLRHKATTRVASGVPEVLSQSRNRHLLTNQNQELNSFPIGTWFLCWLWIAF